MDANAACDGKCRCRIIAFLESSIGKKITVALAGVLLCGFLLAHLVGNLFLFSGEAAFNHYAELLMENPLLPAAEIGLVFLFLMHIALSVRATWLNRAARPEGYVVYRSKGARTPGSRTMAATGALLLVFLAVHVGTFKYQVGGSKGSDLFAHVSGWFANPVYALFYILALGGLGLHLSHGAQSALQTFGLNHPRYTPALKKAGLAFAALVFLGFASMPLYFGFIHKAGGACCTTSSGGAK
ncbi:MAG: succinate dehydrogenase cytochrome b subunit [Elusimicrobiota bacterium]